MAGRTDNEFNYEEISNIYNEMKNITGSAGDADSIAGILDKIDKDVRTAVTEEDGAIYGPLGEQLFLDWDNSSSDFPNFVNNFQNWATLIAQSAGKYQEFEEKVQQAKIDNPLGLSAKGMTQNYIETSYYKDYKNSNYEQYVADLANVKPLQVVTGAEYTFTDSVSILKKHQIATGIQVGLVLAGAAIIGAGLAGVGSGGAEVGTELATTGGAGGGGAAIGGTSAIGSGGQAITMQEFAAEVMANGTPQQIAALQSLQNSGVTMLVSNGAEIQCLNSSGQVIASFMANNAGAAAAATTASATVSPTAAAVVTGTGALAYGGYKLSKDE